MSVEEMRKRVRGLMPRAREDLARMVAMPSVADPSRFPPEACLEAAEFVRDAVAEAGIADCRLLEMPDGHPAVVGHAPGPPGSPTVLLYCHYDVQPPLGEGEWESPPFELVERDGRWYGRGAADCKGNIAVHLTALRALGGELPVGVKFIAEGAEEQGTGELERFVPADPDTLRADAILIADAGNAALGVPTLTTTLRGIAGVTVRVETLEGEVHSGMFGGPAPDALVALVRMLATLHDDRGNVAVPGLDEPLCWEGADYPAERFRSDARVLDGVELVGNGSVADLVWARPSIAVLGIDCPAIAGSTPSLQPRAAARLGLRVPPGMDPERAQDALVAHLEEVAPWGARIEVEREDVGAPFAADAGGPANRGMAEAMEAAYGREAVTVGQGASIPLCNVLAETYPDADIVLYGVEEPRSRIHAPNESVAPSEIEQLALAEALFLAAYGQTGPPAP